jgi:hypothetical protein
MHAVYVLESGNAVLCSFQHESAAKITVVMRFTRTPTAADRVEAEDRLASIMEDIGFEDAAATPLVYGHPN